ncbi:hypothetical protein NQ314_019360 [Rhamnusium bicolor]|uniref:Uncharacterized protein n=1 Tax=Rhamnusium bicolor TaxID=1586634 RepID=A0AAV8WNK8_9CUCU|nr:hypothetical protein NQ314_019360 [Rhamnusium bicolor]
MFRAPNQRVRVYNFDEEENVIDAVTDNPNSSTYCSPTKSYQRNATQEENPEETRVFIIEDRRETIIVVHADEGDGEKYNVKYSYENLAPPPYFRMLSILAESSYEIPPSYPIDMNT